MLPNRDTKKAPQNKRFTGLSKALPAGLEPATNGLTVREEVDKNTEKTDSIDPAAANTQQTIPICPQLEKLIDCWEELPVEIKTAIFAIVESVSR